MIVARKSPIVVGDHVVEVKPARDGPDVRCGTPLTIELRSTRDGAKITALKSISTIGSDQLSEAVAEALVEIQAARDESRLSIDLTGRREGTPATEGKIGAG